MISTSCMSRVDVLRTFLFRFLFPLDLGHSIISNVYLPLNAFLLVVLQIYFSINHFFSNKVIMHFNVLCSCMEHWVFCKLNVAHIVTPNCDSTIYIFSQIKKQSSNPYFFTCSYCSSSILSFST